MPRRRLVWQLVPSYLLITLVSLVAVTWYATRTLRAFHHAEVKDALEARARLVAPRVQELLEAGDLAAVDPLCKERGAAASTRITVMLPSGTVVGDSDEDPARMEPHDTPDRPEMMAALGRRTGLATRHSTTLRREMMYLAIPLARGDELVGVLRTSLPTTAIEAALTGVYRRLIVAGVVMAFVAAAVSLLVSRRITRPLEEMKRGADRFAEGDLEGRLPVPPTLELATLAESMNQMAAQLDAEFRTIRRQRNEQEAILASMVEGVFAVNTAERLITMNQAAAAMLGLPDAAVQGRSIQEAVRNTALQDFVGRALGSEEPVEEEITVAGNGERVLQLHGAVLCDARGRHIGAVVVLNDVTRLRRLEDVRRQFVANVSHELKTPITSIKGFVETLLDGALDQREDAERFLRIIARQVDRLYAIVEDLLLLSRLEQDTGEPAIRLEDHPVREVLEAAVEVCSPKAVERSVPVEVQCPAGLAAPISSALLEQAVINLLDNAISYSEPGRPVHLGARGEAGEVVLFVRDEGCGIAPEHLPRLFERFYRIDKARSRKLGGTGLGLAIVKHIAQAHGGAVHVASEPGVGSTFTLRLPRARPAAPAS